ncbi:MAG: PEGA domain-containing protein [Nitrospirota bacterium]
MKSFPVAVGPSSGEASAIAGVQYLFVACNVTRVVTVDGRNVGRTDEVIELPAGEHTVSLLAPPQNFRPKERRITLAGTSPEKPMVVRFETR